jgi:hypothetical protein
MMGVELTFGQPHVELWSGVGGWATAAVMCERCVIQGKAGQGMLAHALALSMTEIFVTTQLIFPECEVGGWWVVQRERGHLCLT